LELGGNAAVNAFEQPATVLFKENSFAEGNRIAEEIRAKGNDLVVSIGGGRVLDLGKYVATRAQVNYISIPTSPSNDALCSPVAVLKNADGLTESVGVNMPIGVLVDTNMLRNAPETHIRAGVGDLLSKFSAIADWKLAYHTGKDRMDDFAASIALSGAQLMFESLDGKQVDLHDPKFLEKLVNGLILAGIAMNIAGSSRPCSGAEHKISHAIDALYPNTSLHGLQVAFGTLFAMFMRGENSDALIPTFKLIGLPITYQELGLTDEQFVQVLLKAPVTRERYTIFEKLHLDATQASQLIQQYNEHISQHN
jgi:glycerol-1-phosphate dehydrogenase [NAD(P)+]